MKPFNHSSGHEVSADRFEWDCGCHAVSDVDTLTVTVVSCSVEHDAVLQEMLEKFEAFMEVIVAAVPPTIVA